MFKNSAPFVSTCKALMAKLVRHLTSNEEIVGSNPAESMCLYVLLFLHQKQNDVSVVWDVIEFFFRWFY